MTKAELAEVIKQAEGLLIPSNPDKELVVPVLDSSMVSESAPKRWQYKVILEAIRACNPDMYVTMEACKKLVKRSLRLSHIPVKECTAPELKSFGVAKDSPLFNLSTNGGQLAYSRADNYIKKLVHNQFIITKERSREEGDGEGGEATELYYVVTHAGAAVLHIPQGEVRYIDGRKDFIFPELEEHTDEIRASVMKSLCARHVHDGFYGNRALNYKLIQIEIYITFALWIDVSLLKLPPASRLAP